MKIVTRFIVLILFLSISIHAEIQYPTTKKLDHVDDYRGLKVSDPYRWLEDNNSKETAHWVEA